MFLKSILLERYPSRQIFEHMLSSLVAVLSYVLKLKSTSQRWLEPLPKKKTKTICSIALPVPRVPAEFECALSSCLGCAFTLQVPSLVTARMWRLIFNAIYESLSTRAYASCTSELQVSGRIVWRCCENDCLDLSVYKRMEGWEKAISLVLGVRSWESEEGKSLRKWVLMVKHIF